jgi:DNA-binding transcriptional LysR family regulator
MRGTEFAELNAFVAVADQRSFAKAAVVLGIAPSTLSQTIRSLEDRLGVRLLNRTTRSVAPTEAGERLLAQLHPALEGLSSAVEAVDVFRDTPTGMLRLTMPRAAATVVVAPILGAFLAAYPTITLEIAVDDSRSDIVSGRFDAGIRLGERIEQDMITLRVFDAARIVTVAAPAYLAKHGAPTTPNDLHDHNCIRQRWVWDGAIHPWEFEQAGRRIEVAVDGTLIVNDLSLALTAALDGAGIGNFPEPAVSAALAEGRLVPLLGGWCRGVSGLFLYYSSRRQIPRPLQAFIDFVRVERARHHHAG